MSTDGVPLRGAPPDRPTGPTTRDWVDHDLRAFVAAAVVEQLLAFSQLGGEHRLVAVGFVLVEGIAASLDRRGPNETAAALGALIDQLIAATEPYGVTALHTDIANDGFKVVLCAGAPVNPGDISDALLNAQLQIAKVDSEFTIRQGAQTGRVFAGFLGAAYRRTYTLMGDPVNTAARMLGKAGDRDIVAVAEMVDDTRAVFETEALEPFLVKGKTEPIVACKVRSASDVVRRDGSSGRLVGRSSELDTVSRAIAALGEVVDIVGPAGAGKSRLLDAAFDHAEGLLHFHGSCTPYGAASPYSVFRPLLRSGLGIDVRASREAAGELLREVVELRAPHLLPMLPLLAVPFGADVSSTPEADAIDPEFRRARIHDAVLDLYDTTLDGRPVFLVIEDLHWVDDASAELVSHLVRAAATRPWAGVTTRRPEGGWQPDRDLAHVTTVELHPLDSSDIRQLIIEASPIPLSDEMISTIAERSEGNPLFALELAKTSGHLSIGDLPGSVEQVISSRIDDLPPRLRHLLRIASVFGTSFDARDLAPALDVDPGDLELDHPDLLDVVEHSSGSSWGFRHALYRDAVYEGLPYRRRRELHRRIGRYLESRSTDPSSIASLLSVHFTEGADWPAAWTYSRLAGSQAAGQYALTDAAAAFARAIKAAGRTRTVPAADRRAVGEQLGDALLAVGRYEEAFAAFGTARRVAAPLEEIDLMRRQGMVRDRQGSVTAAVRWYERCLRRLNAGSIGPEEQRVRLHVALAYAAARHRQGRFPECLEWARRAEQDAVALGDTASQAKALDRLHVAATYLGLPEAEEHGPAALTLHRRLGDHLSQARILDNMGIQAYFAYRWDEALELYRQAADAGQIAGDVIEANLGRMNGAEVQSDRGHFAMAEAEFRAVLRNWQAAGWAFGRAAARSNLGLVICRGRRSRDGVDMLATALAEFEQQGANEFIVETTVRLAEAHVHLGDAAGVRRVVDTALDLADDDPTRARALRQLGSAHLLDGRRADADQSLNESVRLAASSGARYEEGLSRVLLASATGDSDTGRIGAQLLAELGVVELPFALVELGAVQPATSSS
jgi:tetratricopeptide (TPR) repeat protein